MRRLVGLVQGCGVGRLAPGPEGHCIPCERVTPRPGSAEAQHAPVALEAQRQVQVAPVEGVLVGQRGVVVLDGPEIGEDVVELEGGDIDVGQVAVGVGHL
jgi:hypothetical protein